jgi:hypothetical protein
MDGKLCRDPQMVREEIEIDEKKLFFSFFSLDFEDEFCSDVFMIFIDILRLEKVLENSGNIF